MTGAPLNDAARSILQRHVATAPATYYAYAYDRRLADAVWRRSGDAGAGDRLAAFLAVASEAPDPRLPLDDLLRF